MIEVELQSVEGYQEISESLEEYSVSRDLIDGTCEILEKGVAKYRERSKYGRKRRNRVSWNNLHQLYTSQVRSKGIIDGVCLEYIKR